MASECHMDYFDDAFMVFYVSFWRHEDNSSTKNHRTFNSSRVFSKLCTILSQRRQERREAKMKENQRAQECQRSDEGRWAKRKQHLSTYLKSPAGRAQAHSVTRFTPRGITKEQSKQICSLWRAWWRAELLLVIGRKSQRVSLMQWKSIQLPAGISCCQQRESEIN